MRYITAFGAYTVPPEDRRPIYETGFRELLTPTFRGEGVIDGWGEAEAPVAPVTIPQDFMLLADNETALEVMRTALSAALSGRKKLFLNHADTSLGPELYTYARARNVRIEDLSRVQARVSLTFSIPDPRLIWPLTEAQMDLLVDVGADASDTILEANWGESWDERVAAIWTAPTTFEITNPGERRIRPVLRVDGGFTNPRIENLTTAQAVELAGTGSIWQVNAANQAHGSRTSADGGLTWTNVWPDTTINPLQGRVMELAPGVNQFSCSGTIGRLLIVQRPVFLL